MEEQELKKIEVKVLEDFFDHYYGKERKVGDVFVCRGDLAFKRKNFAVNGISRPLVETPEDTKLENKFEELIDQYIKK